MECDPTVSYSVAGMYDMTEYICITARVHNCVLVLDLDGKSGLDDEESDAESTASAPLLGKQVKEEDGRL